MTKQRDETIDILKGILVFGMILSHVSGLISNHHDFPIKTVWLLTGLVTFSGFLFCFGYACQLAYFSKDFANSAHRMAVTALKPLIAFYISATYWRLFVDKDLSFTGVLKILTLTDIPPFSEFLVSFSLIILVSAFVFRPIQWITANKTYFWGSFFLILATTLLSYHFVQLNQLGLLIGTEEFPAFPVLQYFPVFLLGIYFAKHQLKRDRNVELIAIAGFVAFVLFYGFQHQLPRRFPPSPLWITASIFLVYLYYLLAQYLIHFRSIANILSAWGKNVLFYLLISNLLIFTFRGAYKPLDLNLMQSLGITLLMLFTINFFTTIVAPRKPTIASSKRIYQPDNPATKVFHSEVILDEK